MPLQPPSRLAHTTKKRSVSSGRPGPMIVVPPAAARRGRRDRRPRGRRRSGRGTPRSRSRARRRGSRRSRRPPRPAPSVAPESSVSGRSAVKRTTRRVSTRPRDGATARRKLVEAPAGCQRGLSLPSMEDGHQRRPGSTTTPPERFVGLRRALGVTELRHEPDPAAPRRARADPRPRAPGGGLPRARGAAHRRDRGRPPTTSRRASVDARGPRAVRRRVLNRGPGLCSVLALGGAGRARGARRHRLPRLGRHRAGTPAGDPAARTTCPASSPGREA